MTPSYQVFYRDPKTGLLERAYGDAGKQRAGRFRADVEQASVEHQATVAEERASKKQKTIESRAKREAIEGAALDALEASEGSPDFIRSLNVQRALIQERTKQRLEQEPHDTRPVLPDPEVFDEAMP
jgi:hypothetical protein